MTRSDYLNQLKNYLTGLTEEELEDALDYFEEYFADRNNDEEAIQDLGNPKEAAEEILRNLGKDNEQAASQQKADDNYADLGTNIRNAVHQYLHSSFLKNFFNDTNVSININGKQDTVQTEPIPLLHLEHIQLEIGDTNLIIHQTDIDLPQLLFEIEKGHTDTNLPYCFEHGKLVLREIDSSFIEKMIIELPHAYHLKEISGTLEDANASMKEISMTHLSLRSEDTNLTLSQLEISELTLHLEDSNLSFIGSQVTDCQLEAEDSNLTLQNCQFQQANLLIEDSNLNTSKNNIAHTMNIELTDSHLTLERGSETKENFSIESTDSILQLADDLQGNTQCTGNTTIFQTNYDHSPANLTIHCEDSYVTIK